MPTWFGIERLYTQTRSCHGPAGGAPAAGIDGGVLAQRIPQDTPPHLVRRGEIEIATNQDTHRKQRRRPTPNCDTLPNHVLPLARFGAPPAYVTAAWCGPTTLMLAREVGGPNNAIRRPSMYLCLVAG
jgi:hypothetical protein